MDSTQLVNARQSRMKIWYKVYSFLTSFKLGNFCESSIKLVFSFKLKKSQST